MEYKYTNTNIFTFNEMYLKLLAGLQRIDFHSKNRSEILLKLVQNEASKTSLDTQKPLPKPPK